MLEWRIHQNLTKGGSTHHQKSSEIPRFADFDVAEIRESAPDASELSIYRHACDLLGVPPNSAVLKKIRDEGGYQKLSTIDCRQNFLSDAGTIALLAVVAGNTKATVFDFSGNGLRAGAVRVLVDILLRQPHFTSAHHPRHIMLDVAHNPIGDAGVDALLALVQKVSVTNIGVEGTGIRTSLRARLMKKATENGAMAKKHKTRNVVKAVARVDVLGHHHADLFSPGSPASPVSPESRENVVSEAGDTAVPATEEIPPEPAQPAPAPPAPAPPAPPFAVT